MKLKIGFSLIEISIVLAILSILAILSFPSYQHHIATAHHLAAQNELERISVAMEEYYLHHHTYKDATLSKLGFPDTVEENHYQFSIKAASDDDYTLVAHSDDNDDIELNSKDKLTS